MNVEIEIEEEDDYTEALVEVAEQIKEETNASVVTLQLALPPASELPAQLDYATAKSRSATFREILGTIELAKHGMVESHAHEMDENSSDGEGD